jgi:hypothetical protein
MNTYRLVIQVIWSLRGGGSESARSRLIGQGSWTVVFAVGKHSATTRMCIMIHYAILCNTRR